MDCKQAEERLYDWLQKALWPRDEVEGLEPVNAHLEGCPGCRARFDAGLDVMRRAGRAARNALGGEAPVAKAVAARGRSRAPRQGDWAHPVARGMTPADHDAHLSAHEEEFRALRAKLVGQERGEAHETVRRMRACARHWLKHRIAKVQEAQVAKGMILAVDEGRVNALREMSRSLGVRGSGRIVLRKGTAARFTAEDARRAGERLGVEWGRFSPEALARGMNVELEHQDVTGGDPLKTARVAVAHLRERPDYYERLAQAEGSSRT